MQPIHNVVVTLILQRQNYNVAAVLHQLWIVCSTHGALWIMHWQRCCNVEIATSDSHPLHNIDITTSNSQCRADVASTLDGKFTTSSRRRYYDVAPTLHQLFKECQMWTIHAHITFQQPCLKVMGKFNNRMTFVWYADSILWHQVQAIIFLS